MDSIIFCFNYILFGFCKYIMSVGTAWSWSYDSWLYIYAISAYHHQRGELESRLGEIY